MKKIKNMALLGATALVGVIGFSACSSDEEVGGNNGAAAAGETVKTAFTLSITEQAKTRMADGAAQETNVFSGMTGIQMFPFTTTNNGAVTGNDILSLSAIGLADFDAFDYNNNAKVYTDVSIPVGVNHFLFYGKKKDGQGGELAASYDSLTIDNADEVSKDIYFNLVPFNKNLTFATIDATVDPVKTILAALNGIDGVLTTAAKDADNGSNFTRYSTNWKKLQVGATATIAKAVEDLYTSMKRIAQNTSAAATLATSVCTEIEKYFTMTASGSEYTAAWTNSKVVFPTILPDGAVGVTYDTTNGFSYAAVTVNGMQQPELNTYVKPARLFYFANTAIGVADAKKADQYNNQSSWGDVYTKLYGNADGTVATTTQSVMLKDQIQYAVGRLDIQAQVSANTVYDSGSGVANSSDKDPQIVTVPNTGYTLTGVLVGGQQQVDWQFKPVSGAAEYTIYDNVTNSAKVKRSAYSDAIHTLVLETPSNVSKRICLEFQNDGKDFYGYNHELIPAGSKFYLVAQLDPSKGTKPQVNGNEIDITQVFKQDYITTVKLTIGKTSLAKAYQTIPDLRSPKLELGLSVNLEWQQGLTFTQDFQ